MSICSVAFPSCTNTENWESIQIVQIHHHHECLQEDPGESLLAIPLLVQCWVNTSTGLWDKLQTSNKLLLRQRAFRSLCVLAGTSSLSSPTQGSLALSGQPRPTLPMSAQALSAGPPRQTLILRSSQHCVLGWRKAKLCSGINGAMA